MMLHERSRIQRLLEKHTWLLMTIILLAAFVTSLGMVQLDQALRLTPSPDQIWLYGGGADSATAVLSSVSASAVTVAGVIFSATYVTLQLASSQYTPRVVQALTRRWNLQLVLGVFLANFVYSLVVLRSVRPSTSEHPVEFVPVLSVSFCVVLSFICVGVLVYYISYGMHSLQPTFLINTAAEATERLIRRTRLASVQLGHGPTVEKPIVMPRECCALEITERAGFIQQVQYADLLALAREADVTIRLDGEIGTFYFVGERVMSVWPPERCTGELERRIRLTLSIGDERTPEQDVEFGFRRVADIMLRAISAAINDPTTAEYCIQTLGNLIVLLASRSSPKTHVADEDGTIRLLWNPEPFDRCVHTAFGQLRFYCGRDISLVCYALAALERVVALIPPARQHTLIDEAMALRTSALRETIDPHDRAAIEHASCWLSQHE